MEKEKSDAALAWIFDDPLVPVISNASTNASSAGVACVVHSNDVLRHEAPLNMRVSLHEFLYTIPQSAPYKISSIDSRVDRSCGTGTRL